MIGRSRLLARVQRIENLLGPTPIVELVHPEINLFAKLEFCNPVGSLKDKPAFWILKSAIERGEIDESTVVLESSSGNFSNALAVFCRALGLRFMPIIDPNICRVNEVCLRATCDRVVKVDKRDDAGGYLKTRLDRLRELTTSIESSYWTNQYANLDALDAHYRFTGGDICDAFTSLDYVFIGVGTSGTIGGVSRRLREKFPRVKIIAVDAEGSVIFGGEPRRRCIPGIGATMVPPLLTQATIDDVVHVSEIDTVVGCHALLREHGLFVGGSSGSAYSAIQRLLPELRADHKPNVLFLCSDRGAAYADSVYNAEWVARNLTNDEGRVSLGSR